MQLVIIPVDFSETSLNAARFAAKMLAWKDDTKAVLYHNYESENDHDISLFYLESLKKEFHRAGVRQVSCEYEMGGDLIENVSRLAHTIRATLILMGITGKSALRQVMFGSNTLTCGPRRPTACARARCSTAGASRCRPRARPAPSRSW